MGLGKGLAGSHLLSLAKKKKICQCQAECWVFTEQDRNLRKEGKQSLEIWDKQWPKM